MNTNIVYTKLQDIVFKVVYQLVAIITELLITNSGRLSHESSIYCLSSFQCAEQTPVIVAAD